MRFYNSTQKILACKKFKVLPRYNRNYENCAARMLWHTIPVVSKQANIGESAPWLQSITHVNELPPVKSQIGF